MQKKSLKEIFSFRTIRKNLAFVFFLIVIIFYIGFKISKMETTETNPYANYQIGDEWKNEYNPNEEEDYSALLANKLNPKVEEALNSIEALQKQNKALQNDNKEMQEKIKLLAKDNQQPKPFNSPFGFPIIKDNPNFNNPLTIPPNGDLEVNYPITTVVEWGGNINAVSTNNASVKNTEKIEKKEEKKEEKMEKTTWLPSGTLFMIKLDNGTLNPTMSSAIGDAFSTSTSTVVTEAYLPNSFKYDLRGAKVTLESKGQLSTERVDYRPVRLSAIRNDLSMMDIGLSGFVSDIETGMQGLAGTPVSKQEALFWGAVKAYALGNIGKNFASTANELITSTSGTVTSINDKSVTENMGYGLMGGLGEGMQEVGKNVLKIATATETVIESLAGQYAIVHLTEPLELKFKIQKTAVTQTNVKTKQPTGGNNNVANILNKIN
jgi:hypothetical protein